MRQDKVEENVCYPIMSKMKKNLYEEVFVPALVATVNSILSLHREYVLICVFTTSNSIIGYHAIKAERNNAMSSWIIELCNSSIFEFNDMKSFIKICNDPKPWCQS